MPDNATSVGISDGIATLTLNRPDVRNALTEEIALGILESLDEIAESDARCLVIRGAEGAFSAGGDVNSMIEGIEADAPLDDRVRHIVETTGKAIARVNSFPLPTIAKIEGTAFGAGANLAIACNVLLASESAKISFGFRQVGLAVDAGTSYLLPRIVGQNVAQELVLTGELIDSERAKRLGIFNHVYPDNEFDDQADDLIAKIATGPTIALRTSSRLVREGLDRSMEQTLSDEAAAQASVFESRDHEEGVRAFQEGREPDFEGR